MGIYGRLNGAAGWREYRVSGALPAAFLNRCAHARLPLLSAEAEDEYTLTVRLRAADARRARRLAVRAGCGIKETGRGGALAARDRLLRRWPLALGLLLVCALLLWSRCRIWEIRVVGAETVSAGRVLDALADCGVGLGTFWPDLRSDLVRSALLERLPELRWATVNISGSRAEVIVRERIPKPEIWNRNEPFDLVARRPGFVTKVTALNGTAKVKAGQAVDAGDVLISGVSDSAFGGPRTGHAAGAVQAETYYELSAATPLTRQEKGAAWRRCRWALLVGKNRVNFYRNSSISPAGCDMITQTWALAAEGLFELPLVLVRETLTGHETVPAALDEQTALRSMEAELHARLLAEMDPQGEVREEHYTVSRAGGLLLVTLRARCAENIAAEAPITEIN